MAIQQGTYRTRGGRRAVVLCNDAPGYWPIVGYIKGIEHVHPRAWQGDGRSFYTVEHADDLIVVTPSPTVTIIDESEVAV